MILENKVHVSQCNMSWNLLQINTCMLYDTYPYVYPELFNCVQMCVQNQTISPIFLIFPLGNQLL